MNILITGSQGFIGSYLVQSLLDAGHTITGLDIYRGADSADNYRVVEGSIHDENVVLEALKGVECIIHLAAEHKDFGISDEEYFRVNEKGTQSLLEYAALEEVNKFIFFSSVAVYGDSHETSEKHHPAPNGVYGKSKLKAEAVVKSWASENPQRAVTIIRPTVVFGPKNFANIFRLISRVVDGKFFWVGSGDNIKSVAYVENLVSATLFLLDHLQPGFSVYNYSDEPQMAIKKLVEVIGEKAHVEVPKMHIPLPIALLAGNTLNLLGKIFRYNFEITPARMKKFCTDSKYPSNRIRDLGFKQPISVEDGIERTVNWYLNFK